MNDTSRETDAPDIAALREEVRRLRAEIHELRTTMPVTVEWHLEAADDTQHDHTTAATDSQNQLKHYFTRYFFNEIEIVIKDEVERAIANIGLRNSITATDRERQGTSPHPSTPHSSNHDTASTKSDLKQYLTRHFFAVITEEVEAAVQRVATSPAFLKAVQREQPAQLPTDANSETAAPTTYYSHVPANGLFFAQGLYEAHLPQETIYQIDINPENPDRATYQLVNDATTVQHAFKNMDAFISVACLLNGTGQPQAGAYRLERGTLTREGQNWRIVQKAVLSY